MKWRWAGKDPKRSRSKGFRILFDSSKPPFNREAEYKLTHTHNYLSFFGLVRSGNVLSVGFLFIFFCFSLIFPCPLAAKCPIQQFHDATYKLGWDINFSPYAGGEDLLFAHRSAERIEGLFLGKTPVCYSKTASSRFWRLSELYLGWLPVNYLATVAQHEVFGHGYRIRDIGRSRAQVKGYSFNPPPPYGEGGAATSYDIGSDLTTTEETSIAMAGVESTAVLALLTKFKWLEANRIDPRQSILYLLCQHDLNLYIGTLKILDEDEDGHDIKMYIKSLNYTYTNHFLSGARLRSLSWINLGDPFTFYAIYSWFHYFLSGKETRIPMIPIYGFGYLPNIRLGLTPFGPEFFIENYLLKGRKPIYFYLKGGRHSQNRYGGIGFYTPGLWEIGKWLIGCRFDLWRQPKLLLEPGNILFPDINFSEKPNKNDPLYPYSEQHAMRVGWAGSLIFGYHNRNGFEAELGYKARGFLPGFALRSSPTARLYYTLVF